MIRAVRSLAAELHRLKGDAQGSTLTEFGFVGPVLILMIMGLFDIAHTQYTTSLVNGAMQRAARELTLENAGSRQSDIDARVRAQIRTVTPSGARIRFEKLSHFDFSDIKRPEEIVSGNGDLRCDTGERYIDANDNGRFDLDRGKSGIGGARDAVLYTAIVTYPRMFPMYGLAGMSEEVRIESSTVLRNQPYDEQDRTATERTC